MLNRREGRVVRSALQAWQAARPRASGLCQTFRGRGTGHSSLVRLVPGHGRQDAHGNHGKDTNGKSTGETHGGGIRGLVKAANAAESVSAIGRLQHLLQQAA